MIKEINSSSNPQIKQLRALVTSKKVRQESQRFIIEGWRGIDTLLTHESRSYTLEKLVITPDWEKDPRLPQSLECILVPDFIFDKISDVKNAQGILAVVQYTEPPFEFYPDTGHYLLLDAIRDPGNLGTLIRSAVGAGFDGVLLYGDCVEAFNPKVIRSTMGTFAFANIWKIVPSDLDRLTDAHYDLCITTGHEGQNVYETTFSKKTVLAIGSEAHGISEELMQRATHKITIPLAKECESLNAAIAGSICMFQIQAQKGRH
jgi:TrmH family RNA methyltransferase